jgi:hypothetical protein
MGQFLITVKLHSLFQSDFICDDDFWCAVKEASGEMTVPIIIICDDYLRFRKIMWTEPLQIGYSSMTFTLPSAKRFSEYIRVSGM